MIRTEGIDGVLTLFRAAGIPERRSQWIRKELANELTTAVMRVAAAHPDVAFWVGGEMLVPDVRAESVDVIGIDALNGGAADGRTTEEIAEAAGLPRRTVESALSHPKAGLALGDDGRWHPRPGDR